VIDGANWGSPYGNIATKLHEVAKYYCGPSLINYDMEDMFINMDAWKSMPKDLQEILISATRTFALERASYSTYLSCLAFDQMKKAGVTITDLPKDEVEQMRKLSWELLPKMIKPDPYIDRAMKIINDTMRVFNLRPRFSRG
jgi:TRAP-type mannitol/chloroaromatic compound transport system substrate-binding protein